MKLTSNYLTLLLVVFCFTTCNKNQKSKTQVETSKSENFDWLLGKWKRTNEDKGKETFENWEKMNQNQYNGIGYTLQNNDTVSQEKMTLIKYNDAWQLLVEIPHEKETATFEMSEFSDAEFECKNDTLQFPKQIKYWKEGTKIKALVAGDSLTLTFEFEKIQ